MYRSLQYSPTSLPPCGATSAERCSTDASEDVLRSDQPHRACKICDMSNEVALRPVREDDVPRLEQLTQDPEKTGEFEWFGWSDLRRWRRGWEENGLIGPNGGR